MKLVRVEGNFRTQRALSHTYVKTIVDILIQDREILALVADVLQTVVRRDQPELMGKLEAIRKFYRRADAEGNLAVPSYIDKLTKNLQQLYHQSNENIDDQRGAILEALGHRLICSRYTNDDICINSGRFLDEQNREITIQEVDVAALSDTQKRVEGYECKVKSNKLESHDCIDLEYLFVAAQQRGYKSNVGVISLDSDDIVQKKLKRLEAAYCIKIYGLESIGKLQNLPY